MQSGVVSNGLVVPKDVRNQGDPWELSLKVCQERVLVRP